MPDITQISKKYEAAYKNFLSSLTEVQGKGTEIPPALQEKMAQFISDLEALAAAQKVPLPDNLISEAKTNIARHHSEVNRSIAGMQRELQTTKDIYPGHDYTLNLALKNFVDDAAHAAGAHMGVGRSF